MKKIIYSVFALVALASCAKETKEVESFDDNVVRISSGIETRASGTSWSSGDAISVFAYNTGQTSDSDKIADNIKHTANSSGTSSLFTPTSYFYYPTDGTNIDVYAIYPYAESTTLSTYSIDVSSEKQSDHTLIDLMSAKVTNQEKSADPISMTFSHILAQVQVTLSAAENGGLKDDDIAAATVKLGGTIVSGNYSIASSSNNAITLTSGAVASNIEITATDKVATFMVIPQEATLVFTITVDGVNYSTSDTTFTMASSSIYAYDITVSKTAVQINGSTINAWSSIGSESLNATN